MAPPRIGPERHLATGPNFWATDPSFLFGLAEEDANCVHFVGRTGAVFHMTCPHIYFRRRFDRTPDKVPSVQEGDGDTPPMCRGLLEGPR